jgi:hypothetical protein
MLLVEDVGCLPNIWKNMEVATLKTAPRYSSVIRAIISGYIFFIREKIFSQM